MPKAIEKRNMYTGLECIRKYLEREIDDCVYMNNDDNTEVYLYRYFVKGKKNFLQKYIAFNSMGTRVYPVSHFKDGVTMLSILISAFIFIGCGGKDADSATTEDTAAAAEE